MDQAMTFMSNKLRKADLKGAVIIINEHELTSVFKVEKVQNLSRHLAGISEIDYGQREIYLREPWRFTCDPNLVESTEPQEGNTRCLGNRMVFSNISPRAEQYWMYV